ncbi:hypothetical protein [Paraeggerthella sp.]
MSSVPVTNASENMPACSTPTSCVTTMVRKGNTMPHVAMPSVLHT